MRQTGRDETKVRAKKGGRREKERMNTRDVEGRTRESATEKVRERLEWTEIYIHEEDRTIDKSETAKSKKNRKQKEEKGQERGDNVEGDQAKKQQTAGLGTYIGGFKGYANYSG